MDTSAPSTYKLAIVELQKYRYEKAVRLLQQIDETVRTTQIDKLFREAQVRTDEVNWLRADLRDAVAYDEHLLPIARRLLKLCPDDSVADKLVRLLQQRTKQSATDPQADTVKWPMTPAKSAWRFPIQLAPQWHKIDATQLKSAHSLSGPDEYCVATGLALQGLQRVFLNVNLAPREKGSVFSLLKGRKAVHASAWGIDLGRSALRAIKLGRQQESDQIIALETDVIDHEASQNRTGGEIQKSIELSVQRFLDRHDLKNCAVAISLPAQRVLMRFFGLPLSDKKKITEIMHYEVKQQIPLPLETIAWDYQILESPEEQPDANSVPDHGIALFAIKLEEVQVLLKPFADRRIKVDVVQSDSAALLNFFMHEHPLAAVKHNDQSIDPIGVLAMLDIGTDSSNIVMTNGRMLAMRSIPLGGNDFTRALVKKYNLDWRQAEKLKRNPTSAPLLHQTYEALQPCFQNLYAEVHRSIDQFITLDRRHVVQRLFVRGGGLKLHGLLKYFWLGR